MSQREVNQIRKLKRKGNYYYFKVHRFWIESFLGLKNMDIADVTIKIPTEVEIPKYNLNAFKKGFPELRNFSDKQLTAFLNTIRIEKGVTQDVNHKDLSKVLNLFENKLKTTRGEKFLKNYKTFKKIVTAGGLKKLKQTAKTVRNKEFQKEYDISLKIAKSMRLKV